jgi:uncharacterized membrane protein (UPF0127 family)
MDAPPIAARLRRLPRRTILGREIPVARGFCARLLGLAFLDRDAVGAGLLIERCASVHTFGMRFALDLLFLDDEGGIVEIHRCVGRRRIVACRAAAAVVEVPSRGPVRPLGDLVANLVGENGEATDLRLQGSCETDQRRVAGIANPPLETTDVSQVNPGEIGELLLA